MQKRKKSPRSRGRRRTAEGGRVVDVRASGDLVRLNVDVLVLPNPYRIEAGLKQTKTIPIVTIDLESDPVARGWLASLARPGGNLTGVWMDFPDIAGKQLQMSSNKATPLPPGAPDLTKIKLIDYDFVKYGASAERQRLLKKWDSDIGSLPR